MILASMARLRMQLAAAFVLAIPHLTLAVAVERRLTYGTSVESRQQALEATWEQELGQESSESQVHGKPTLNTLVNLLESMRVEMEKERDNDAKVYDEMSCWCETNGKTKKKDIDTDQSCIRRYTNEIEMRSAKKGVHIVQIPQLKNDIDEGNEALAQASALREQEAQKYSTTSSELTKCITNAQAAVTVLSKHNSPGTSFMQTGSPLLGSMRVLLRDLALKHQILTVKRMDVGAVLLSLGSRTTRKTNSAEADEAFHEQDRALLGALDFRGEPVSDDLPIHFAEEVVAKSAKNAQADQGTFLQSKHRQPDTYLAYHPANSPVYGILTQILEEFQQSLSEAQEAEKTAIEDYAKLTAAKNKEIAAVMDKWNELQTEQATNLRLLAEAKEHLKSCYDKLGGDEAFLGNVVATCENLEQVWQSRSQMRAKEIAAVAEVTQMLKEDAQQVIGKSLTLLQVRSLRLGSSSKSAASKFRLAKASSMEGASMQLKRVKAVAALEHAMKDPLLADDDLLDRWANRHNKGKAPLKRVEKVHSPRAQLSILATLMKLDSFTYVKVVMDRMLVRLKDQQSAELQFKNACLHDLGDNQMSIDEQNGKKEQILVEMAELERRIKNLGTETEDAKAGMAEAKLEINKASETREEENRAFQQTLVDQRITQEVLTKALRRLKKFYSGTYNVVEGGSLMQEDPERIPTQFSTYTAHRDSSNVMAMIEEIVEDSKALVVEAKADEAKSQTDYEGIVKSFTDEIKAFNEKLTSNRILKGDADWEAANEKDDLQSVESALEPLQNYRADLHKQCDFVIENYTAREKARWTMQQNIQSARAILSGAK